MEATYRVKIQGRLLDDHEDDDLFGTGSTADDFFYPHPSKDVVEHDGGISCSANAFKPNHSHRTAPCPARSKLSHFFKSITIDIDGSKNLHPDGVTPIEWKKPPVPSSTTVLPPAADFDLLELERKSDENINVTINLVRDESPERYRLSEEVASLLDTPEDDRAGVVMGIWEYVRAMGLQEDQERRGIRCDDRLRAVRIVQFKRLIDHILLILVHKLRFSNRTLSSFHKSQISSCTKITSCLSYRSRSLTPSALMQPGIRLRAPLRRFMTSSSLFPIPSELACRSC